jgi:hypothetical protein
MIIDLCVWQETLPKQRSLIKINELLLWNYCDLEIYNVLFCVSFLYCVMVISWYTADTVNWLYVVLIFFW